MLSRRIAALIRRWLKKQASKVNHQDVLSHVHREVDISAGYFALLTLANLIALIGLIQNSSPVIIGAMLISPFMGPILGFGFSFITGDRLIWRKSLHKISLSLFLTIVVAACAAYLSPLQDITQEIIVRTKPNLYDLIIAFLAGTAGAAALCTKRNYLTIVPGVAIATAVIPPLSVTGFGLGTGRLEISLGSFFLFFTNFVAIVISAVIVLSIYGFRPHSVSEEELAGLKKRMIFLAVVLFVISIPLIYTLHRTISDVRLRTTIQNALGDELNRPGESRLSSFTFQEKDDKLEIAAAISATRYLKDAEIQEVEKYLQKSLKKDISLSVEQMKVQPGGLKEEPIKPLVPAIAPPKPPHELITESREGLITLVRRISGKVEGIIAPSKVTDFSAGFQDKVSGLSLDLKITRDRPLTPEELLWLSRMLSADLGVPVHLTVETVPFIPLLIFPEGETALSEEMKKSLQAVSEIAGVKPPPSFLVEAYPEKIKDRLKARAFCDERIKGVAALLTGEYHIPKERIRTVQSPQPRQAAAVRISVIQGEKRP